MGGFELASVRHLFFGDGGGIHRESQHSDARCVVNGVSDGRGRRDDVGFADTTDAKGLLLAGYLDDDGIDHGKVEAGRHPVVEEGGVHHHAVVAHVILFVQRPSDALGAATLHLALDVARVNGFARVLNDGEPQDVDLAGVGIDLHVDDVSGERASAGSETARVERAAAHDGAAGIVELFG